MTATIIHFPSAEQRLIISALVARAIPYRFRGQAVYRRIETVTRNDYRVTWAQCPATLGALLRRLDQE